VAQVIDASVAVAWCARSQGNTFTDSVLNAVAESGGHVPAQFLFEVIHSLIRLERRGTIVQSALDEFVRSVQHLPLTVDAAYETTEMATLYALARRYDLKIYDAAYLDLARRTGLPLATRDVALARAARDAGVALLSA
jgi:predicted nucleic acid-binding protein